MLPDGAGEPAGGELPVPMAWMSAEFLADRVMLPAGVMPYGSVEYRAGRTALAVTHFATRSPFDLKELFDDDKRDYWLLLTADPWSWRQWAANRLRRLASQQPAAGPCHPDVALATEAWRWLTRTELLPLLGPEGTDGRCPWVPAWELGVTLGHLALQCY
ncbi:hypothetical protein AB0C77_13890 [Streptomyces sp. NPDC048629]|uniref:hypothetical protein n=1 Tax=Streptomyces sp. NPDC048629 TaxID=3154824 RepID=UPI00343E426A